MRGSWRGDGGRVDGAVGVSMLCFRCVPMMGGVTGNGNFSDGNLPRR